DFGDQAAGCRFPELRTRVGERPGSDGIPVRTKPKIELPLSISFNRRHAHNPSGTRAVPAFHIWRSLGPREHKSAIKTRPQVLHAGKFLAMDQRAARQLEDGHRLILPGNGNQTTLPVEYKRGPPRSDDL